jgi:hypothetical protein
VADQPRRRQLGVALDELEPDAELGGDGTQQGGLPCPWRALQQDVASGDPGALRQDLPTRPYPVMINNQTVHVSVNGLEGQSHLAIIVMVPWFGEILPLPATQATLGVKLDDARR